MNALILLVLYSNLDKSIFNNNITELEHLKMKTQTGPDPQLLTISSVSLYSLYVLIVTRKHCFLAFPLSLKVPDHLQYLSMYYHRDPPDDPHHAVGPIPERTRRSARKASLSIDLYVLYEITLAETDWVF